MRIEKEQYYLNIAKEVLERGTCLRRNYGAVIVKNDQIVSTGYTGAPRGQVNCCDRGTCVREELNIPRGTRYELCRSVHAEANAVISASREQMIGATIFLAGKDAKTNEPIYNAAQCDMCKRLMINAGIKYVCVLRKNDDGSLVPTYIDVDDEYVFSEKIGNMDGY